MQDIALSDMPNYTLFRKEPTDYIVETENGKDRRINIFIRRLVVRAALLTEKELIKHQE